MKRELKIFSSFASADAADRAYYVSLTPAERLEIQLEIIGRFRESLGETGSRFERVHRVVELSKS